MNSSLFEKIKFLIKLEKYYEEKSPCSLEDIYAFERAEECFNRVNCSQEHDKHKEVVTSFFYKQRKLTSELLKMKKEKFKFYTKVIEYMKGYLGITYDFSANDLKQLNKIYEDKTFPADAVKISSTIMTFGKNPNFWENFKYFYVKTNYTDKSATIGKAERLLRRGTTKNFPGIEIYEKNFICKVDKRISGNRMPLLLSDFCLLPTDKRLEIIKGKVENFETAITSMTLREKFPYLVFKKHELNIMAAEIIRMSKGRFKDYCLSLSDEEYEKDPFNLSIEDSGLCYDKFYEKVDWKNLKIKDFKHLLKKNKDVLNILINYNTTQVDKNKSLGDDNNVLASLKRRIDVSELVLAVDEVNFREELTDLINIGLKADETIKLFKELKGAFCSDKLIKIFKEKGSLANVVHPKKLSTNVVKFLDKYGVEKLKETNEDVINYCINNNKKLETVDEDIAKAFKDDFFKKISCSEEFMKNNKERIVSSIIDGSKENVKNFCAEQNAYHSAGMAYKAMIAGKMFDFKYGYGNGIGAELMDEPSPQIKENWMKDAEFRKDGLHIKEDISFKTSFYIGENPIYTCQNWSSGSYRSCLPSFFDSTKKLATVWKDNILIARALMRLTRTAKDGQKLKFVDVEDAEKEKAESGETILFLERLYAGDIKKYNPYAIELASRKASMMGVKLYVSSSYYNLEDFKNYPKEWIKTKKVSLHINHSKNGKQYLDSFSGSNSVSGGFQEVEVYYIEKIQTQKGEM